MLKVTDVPIKKTQQVLHEIGHEFKQQQAWLLKTRTKFENHTAQTITRAQLLKQKFQSLVNLL